MNRRMVFCAVLAGASVVSSGSLFASPLRIAMPGRAMFAKAKLVKMSLRNEGTAPITLKVGDDNMTLEPGTTKGVELPEGTRILRADATGAAGKLVVQVSRELAGITIALKS